MRNPHLTDEQLEMIGEGQNVTFVLDGHVGGGRVAAVRALSFWVEVAEQAFEWHPEWRGHLVDDNTLGVPAEALLGFDPLNPMDEEATYEIHEGDTVEFEISGISGRGVVTEARELSFHVEPDAESLARSARLAEEMAEEGWVSIRRELVTGWTPGPDHIWADRTGDFAHGASR